MNKEDILELMDKLDASALSELKLKEGEFELTIKKGGGDSRIAYGFGAQAQGLQAFSQAPQGGPAAGATGEANSREGEAESNSPSSAYETIAAPIVGSFFRSPSPDSPAFVDEGSEVQEGDTLCIIEAMKVMNELEAEFPCRIHRVLVENQQMVEYGTPLFEVERLS